MKLNLVEDDQVYVIVKSEITEKLGELFSFKHRFKTLAQYRYVRTELDGTLTLKNSNGTINVALSDVVITADILARIS